MKINRKDSLQITRLLLNLIFYKEVTDCKTMGVLPPRSSAYSYYQAKPELPDELDEEFGVVDLLSFLYDHSMRYKGVRETSSSLMYKIERDYLANPSTRHIYLSLKCLDITPSKASRALERIGTYTDETRICQYLQFSISELYENLPEEDKGVELTLTTNDVKTIWSEVTSDFLYYAELFSRTQAII